MFVNAEIVMLEHGKGFWGSNLRLAKHRHYAVVYIYRVVNVNTVIYCKAI